MANTITVAPGPKLDPGQVAIWERDPEHPAGEIYLAAPQPGDEAMTVEVARTPEVNKRLSDGRLVEAAARPRRQAATVATPPAAAPAEGGEGVAPASSSSDDISGITVAQRDALAAAGFGTAEAIRAATDEQLLAVPSIGAAAVERLRAMTKE